MILILAKYDPLCAGFYSDYSEADTLLLFSRLYGCHDVAIFESSSIDPTGASLGGFVYKKSLTKNKFQKFIRGLTRPKVAAVDDDSLPGSPPPASSISTARQRP